MSVIEGSRGATVLVGMAGFVVGAQQVVDGELWLFAETDRRLGRLFGLWDPGDGSREKHNRGAGLAGRGSSDGVACGEAALALSRTDCEVNTWTETAGGDPPSSGADRTGPETAR